MTDYVDIDVNEGKPAGTAEVNDNTEHEPQASSLVSKKFLTSDDIPSSHPYVSFWPLNLNVPSTKNKKPTTFTCINNSATTTNDVFTRTPPPAHNVVVNKRRFLDCNYVIWVAVSSFALGFLCWLDNDSSDGISSLIVKKCLHKE